MGTDGVGVLSEAPAKDFFIGSQSSSQGKCLDLPVSTVLYSITAT